MGSEEKLKVPLQGCNFSGNTIQRQSSKQEENQKKLMMLRKQNVPWMKMQWQSSLAHQRDQDKNSDVEGASVGRCTCLHEECIRERKGREEEQVKVEKMGEGLTLTRVGPEQGWRCVASSMASGGGADIG
jgi:hypothetical protein